MNPVAAVHLVAAVVVIFVSVPLIRRRVKMNHWYGVRIPAAFESEAAWFDINHYGGRLLLIWGIVIGVVAIAGACLAKKDWLTYDFAALILILGGLAVVVAKIYRYARERKKA